MLHSKRLAQLIALVVVLLLLWTVYQKVQLFIPATVAQQLLPTNRHSDVGQLADIAKMNIFGDYNTVDVGALPTTSLNITLEGVLYGGDVPQAIIGVPGQQTKVYRIGQPVPGGATVKKILPNGVVLEQNGKDELLPLKQTPLQFAPRPDTNGLGQQIS